MRLFLYGTLLDPAVLTRRGWAHPRRQRRLATLAGWHRVRLRGTPYPTLRRGGRVSGIVLEVDAATLRRLTAYEGPRYVLTRVVVRTVTGGCPAWCWIAPEATRRPWKV